MMMMFLSIHMAMIVALACIRGCTEARDLVKVGIGGNVMEPAQTGNSTLDTEVFATANCQGYRMSGARSATGVEGTYLQMSSSYTCNSKPVYRIYSSSLGKYVYLYNYYTATYGYSRWLFSDTRCSQYAYVRAFTTGTSQPNYVSTWQEAQSGSTWSSIYGLTVSCVTSLASCYSCSSSGGLCSTSQYSNIDQKIHCDIGSGYYCWESYTTTRYGGTTVKRECKYGCPYSYKYNYYCSRTCSSGTCSKCCTTSLCNKDSMSLKRASYGCSLFGAARNISAAIWPLVLLACLHLLLVNG